MAPTFETLPPEIRDRIYDEVFQPEVDRNGIEIKYDLALFRTNKQIHKEASSRFWAINTFVKITMHYPSIFTGVHRVLFGEAVESFKGHSMEVQVTGEGPHDALSFLSLEFRHYVILASDLPKVLSQWVLEEHYSHVYFKPTADLDASVTIRLHDPVTANSDTSSQPEDLPEKMQRQLLLPFIVINGTEDGRDLTRIPIEIAQDVPVLPQVEDELRRLRSLPFDPRSHLDKAQLLIAEADTDVDFDIVAAMDKYKEAALCLDVLWKWKRINSNWKSMYSVSHIFTLTHGRKSGYDKFLSDVAVIVEDPADSTLR